jgi:hypothetical protein
MFHSLITVTNIGNDQFVKRRPHQAANFHAARQEASQELAQRGAPMPEEAFRVPRRQAGCGWRIYCVTSQNSLILTTGDRSGIDWPESSGRRV